MLKNPLMSQSQETTILLAEDDPNLGILLRDFLQIVGYKVLHYTDGIAALAGFSDQVDICVLDVMMPRMDGFTLSAEIRAKNPLIPVIFLTAKSLPEDRVKGFKAGCDDYITKPFSTEELQLRIEAILRRCQRSGKSLPYQAGDLMQIGGYTFDHSNLTLKLGQESATLTRKEADLLLLLARHKNQLLTREFTLKTIWGTDDYFIGRSMDVFITKLRKHLKGDPSIAITNVHGVGFRLEVPE